MSHSYEYLDLDLNAASSGRSRQPQWDRGSQAIIESLSTVFHVSTTSKYLNTGYDFVIMNPLELRGEAEPPPSSQTRE